MKIRTRLTKGKERAIISYCNPEETPRVFSYCAEKEYRFVYIRSFFAEGSKVMIVEKDIDEIKAA